MTDEEFKQLDDLLEKLRGQIGRYVINPCHLGELRLIGLYDKDGNLIDQLAGATIKDAVDELTDKS